MKKVVEVQQISKTTVNLEVEFPIYRAHDIGHDNRSVIYSRIDADGSAIHLLEEEGQNGDRTWRIEHELQYRFGRDDASYDLGLGTYQSSEEEFRAAVNRYLEETTGWLNCIR